MAPSYGNQPVTRRIVLVVVLVVVVDLVPFSAPNESTTSTTTTTTTIGEGGGYHDWGPHSGFDDRTWPSYDVRHEDLDHHSAR